MTAQPAEVGGEPRLPVSTVRDDELLSPQRAAAIAGRSVRTIRRAYRSGRLLAYRDGNGQRVGIRYDDLRCWLLATSAAAPQHGGEGHQSQTAEARLRLDMRGRLPTLGPSENMTLLKAARARRRGGAHGGGARPRAGDSASPRV